MRLNKVIMRISIIVLLSVLIWKTTIYLHGILLGQEYNRIAHFGIALFTTVLSLAVIDITRRLDKASWKQTGMGEMRSNFTSFLIGTVLWIIPAAIGLIICMIAGWSEIVIISSVTQLLLNYFILYIIVFLIEAFPEELIMRGYIYSYLNALFPHWVVVVVQTLIFSLFAYFIGAMYSLEQIMFIPGFGFMLGYFRAKSGNVWTSIGFHAAIMTTTQILNPIHNTFSVTGVFAIQFFAFNLLPYVFGAVALEYIYPKHDWHKKSID